MKLVLLSGSNVGSKTRTAMEYVKGIFQEKYPEIEVELIDLAKYEFVFSDGRNYWEYDGDTREILIKIMEADGLIIGTPVFQASIPAVLKNIFDLLPVNAFRDKTIGMLATAGSPKHYLIIEQQLKPILTYMKAEIVSPYVFIEERDFIRKEIKNDDVLFRLERLAEDVLMRLTVHQEIQKKKADSYNF